MHNGFIYHFIYNNGGNKMPSSLKLKIIALGPSNSCKEYFFNNCIQIRNRFTSNYKLTVGVDILTTDVEFSNGEIVTFSIWDIGGQQRFEFIRSTFYKGAAGCLIFFDLKDECLINNLIVDIRNFTERIPIILVVNIINYDEPINFELLNQFVEDFNLAGCYILPNQRDLIFLELGRRIMDYRGIQVFYDEPKVVSDEEHRLYVHFLKFFSKCPICGNKNHVDYLRKFYYSTSSESRKFKERLIVLMNNSEEFDKIYINKIRLGIPCCSCFKEFFSN